jgi:hypothetical protein
MYVIYKPSTFVIKPQRHHVRHVGGTPGPAGTSTGNASIDMVAAVPIGGQRAVSVGGIYADQNTSPEVVGISTAAYGVGQLMALRDSGLLSEPSWNWTPNQPIYLGTAGLLSQVAPTSGYVVHIGIATSAVQIRIAIQPPEFLE